MKSSSLFSVGTKDAIKAFIMAVITAILTSFYTIINSGKMPTMADLKLIGGSALLAALSYIAKNFLTNSNDSFMTKEPPTIVK